MDAVVYVLKTGAPWRDLPERYGPWKSVYNRFSNWSKGCRRLATRYEKTGRNYLGFVHLACALIWLGVLP